MSNRIEWISPSAGWQVDRHPHVVDHAEITKTVVRLVGDEPDERWLIWCDSLADVEHYAQVFADRDVATIQGATPWDDRERIIAEFEAGQVRTLVARIEVLAVGIRLARCSRMIFVDPHLGYPDRAQAEMRCCGPLQVRPVQVHTVTPDELIVRSDENKRRMIAEIMEGMTGDDTTPE